MMHVKIWRQTRPNWIFGLSERRAVKGEDNTLQPTALVNELYLRLLRQRKADWKDRAHFFTFAAKMMRLILTEERRELVLS
jgi:hypothetical protein